MLVCVDLVSRFTFNFVEAFKELAPHTTGVIK